MDRTSITDDVFLSIYFDSMIDFPCDVHLSFEIDRTSCCLSLTCVSLYLIVEMIGRAKHAKCSSFI
jgi:hypothetical protein